MEEIEVNNYNNNESKYSLPEINNQVKGILEDNEYENKDKLIEIIEILINDSEGFSEGKENTFIKRFSNNEYIRLILNGKELSLDMIQRPSNGIDAMLRVILFALENDLEKITGKAQPQKNINPLKYERRRNILLKFYSNFGFKILNSSTGDMVLDLSNENITVFLNKVKYYIENGKWPSL